MTVTRTAAAGRTLRCFLRPLPVLWFCVFPADFLIVEMEGKNQTVLLNDNVTISCKVPVSTPLNTDIMGVIWYLKHQEHETEHKVFEMYGNHQQAFRPGASVSRAGLEKGDVSLHLPGVQLRDAGEYRCKVVVTPEQAQETVFLNVLGSEMGYAWGTTDTYITTVGCIIPAIMGLIYCFKKRKLLLRRFKLLPQEEPEELKVGAFTEVHS